MERDEPSVGLHTHAASAPWAFFTCGERGFAIRLERIHEIVPPQPLARIPGCGPEVCGLIGLRDRVITVFDLGVISGGGPSFENPDHRLVLVHYDGKVVGLAVDHMQTVGGFEVVGGDGEVRAAGRNESAVALMAGGRAFTVLDPDTVFGPRLA
jgi:chemotaxis signal transduction protein